MTHATARGVRRSTISGRVKKAEKTGPQSWRTKRWTPSRWRDLQALETRVNFDMLDLLGERSMVSAAHIRHHLLLHPNDTTAQAALRRAEA